MPHSEDAPKRKGIIRRTLGFFWGLLTWIRVSIANLLILLILVLIVIGFNSEKKQTLPETAALRIAPGGFLVDQRSHIDPVTQLLEQSRPEDVETIVRDLVTTINHASTDPRITTLVLELDYLVGGGISKLEEVGQALSRFKESGKPIIAVADNYTQEQYYLASYADEIYLNPMGAVLLTGYGSYRNYFKSALDKLAINFHIFRVGNYKDFLEPYTRDTMSNASREQNTLWINQLWDSYTQRVETLRKLPSGDINNYINQLDKHLAAEHGNGAQLALNKGLVDKLSSRHDIREVLIDKVGINKDGDDYQAIDYWRYLKHIKQQQAAQPNKIGLLVAAGMIVDGEQPAGTIGGDTFAQLLRDARDSDIQALVLRIDSGGGSAFASEIIRQELQATRDAGIPIVVSMGSVAASGGYWMAAAADEIWATPTTITGSIGVFGAFPTLERSLDKLGIHTDGIATTELAGAIRLDRPLSPLAENVLQQGVEFIYKRFIGLVADARNSTPEAIHEVAQGRVWSGTTAQELGLVDQLGYLEDALQAAAARAELKDFDVELIERKLSPSELIMKQLSEGAVQLAPSSLLEKVAPATLRQALIPLARSFEVFGKMNDPRGVYAHCLMCEGV